MCKKLETMAPLLFVAPGPSTSIVAALGWYIFSDHVLWIYVRYFYWDIHSIEFGSSVPGFGGVTQKITSWHPGGMCHYARGERVLVSTGIDDFFLPLLPANGTGCNQEAVIQKLILFILFFPRLPTHPNLVRRDFPNATDCMADRLESWKIAWWCFSVLFGSRWNQGSREHNERKFRALV